MRVSQYAAVFLGTLLVTASPRPSASAVADSSAFAFLEPTLCVGQPPRWRLALGGLGGYDGVGEKPTGRLFVDSECRIAMPQFGLLDTNLEGALDFDRGGLGSAIGAYMKLPYVRVGVERDLDAHRFDFVVSVQGSARRGGMFRHGERLRIDYSPSRQRVQVGMLFNTPWTRYRPTRPFRMTVDLPSGKPPAPIAADASLVAANDVARVEHAIDWLDRLLTPHLATQGYFSKDGKKRFEGELDELLVHQRAPGHTFAGEDSAYHTGLELAFARACGGDAVRGRALARAAEAVLLEEIVIPFNRQFSRPRRPAGVGGLSRLAQVKFEANTRNREFALDASQSLAACEVFRRVVVRIDGAARAGRKRWDNSSLAWLPLNYGLRPGQYDSQEEIEHVISRLVNEPFSRANSIQYVLNDQFYYLLRNSIRQTQLYHVLWIHDFRGSNSHKQRDRVAWSQATEGYIEAMTAAIGALDRGERKELPVFMVFLDEHYYEVNHSPALISFLEHLSTAKAPVLEDRELGERVKASLARLQAAVRSSPALRERGKDYVRRRVRVQILITYPLDPAFAGDILMRDHRKLAFYDATASDPNSGGGMFTGEGVGEHYQGPDWEDRSLVIRGPEVLRLKTAAWRLLRSQGFDEEEIPRFLREGAAPADSATADRSGKRAGNARLLTAINETGWGPKAATILKAVLYNLMPRGTCMIAPDSLWASDFWAGMFIGAALRGCRAYVIAPTLDNAPSNALPTMGLMHETLAMLFAASQRMAPDLERSGGALRVGLYTRTTDVSDMRSQVEALLDPRQSRAGIFPRAGFHPEVLRALKAEYDTLQSQYAGPVHPFGIETPGKPRIHMKAQFFASAEGLGILSRREWGPILARYLAVRRRQTLAPDSDLDGISGSILDAAAATDSTARDIFTAYEDSLRAIDAGLADRVIYMATVGSHNQDRRSMLLDGEILEAVSGSAALTMTMDFAFLVANATWPATAEELDAQFPETSSLTKRASRWLRNLI